MLGLNAEFLIRSQTIGSHRFTEEIVWSVSVQGLILNWENNYSAFFL